jgi:hypothetical protein
MKLVLGLIGSVLLLAFGCTAVVSPEDELFVSTLGKLRDLLVVYQDVPLQHSFASDEDGVSRETIDVSARHGHVQRSKSAWDDLVKALERDGMSGAITCYSDDAVFLLAYAEWIMSCGGTDTNHLQASVAAYEYFATNSWNRRLELATGRILGDTHFLGAVDATLSVLPSSLVDSDKLSIYAWLQVASIYLKVGRLADAHDILLHIKRSFPSPGVTVLVEGIEEMVKEGDTRQLSPPPPTP